MFLKRDTQLLHLEINVELNSSTFLFYFMYTLTTLNIHVILYTGDNNNVKERIIRTRQINNGLRI